MRLKVLFSQLTQIYPHFIAPALSTQTNPKKDLQFYLRYGKIIFVLIMNYEL